MTPPKKRVSSSQSAGRSGDDGGCLFVLLFVLWFFGFVTFHSRERGKAIERMDNVSAELRKAEAQLEELSTLIGAMRSETVARTEERREVARQVEELERVRSGIAASLAAAEVIVGPNLPSWTERLRRWFSDNVFGNVIASLLAAPIAWYLAQKLRLLWTRRHGRASDHEQPGR